MGSRGGAREGQRKVSGRSGESWSPGRGRSILAHEPGRRTRARPAGRQQVDHRGVVRLVVQAVVVRGCARVKVISCLPGWTLK